MKLLKRKILIDYQRSHADSRFPLDNWMNLIRLAKWHTPQEIKNAINSVDFPEEISVRYKDTVTLTPTVDATSENYFISYDCSDYNVINITSKGEVETYKRGTSVVTCTVEGEGGNTVQKDCKVNVYYSRGQWFIMIFLLGWLWY